MALKQEGVHFVLCLKQGNTIEDVVLNSVYILRRFCPKQGQGLQTSAAYLYPHFGRVPPPGALSSVTDSNWPKALCDLTIALADLIPIYFDEF